MAGAGIIDMNSLSRDFSRAMRQIGVALSAAGRALSVGMQHCGRGIDRASQMMSKVIRSSWRSATMAVRVGYHRWGQYTFPLENVGGELQEGEPPSIPPKFSTHLTNIEKVVHIFPTCLLPLSVFASLTIVPLIGHSLQLIPKAFAQMVNLTSPWKFNANRTLAIRDRAYYGYAYGAVGLLVGGGLGLATATIIGSVRATIELTSHLFAKAIAAASGIIFIGKSILVNSIESFGRTLQGSLNLTAPKKLSWFDDEIDERSAVKKFGAGLIGFALGASVGLVATSIMGVCRVAIELGSHFWDKAISAGTGIFWVVSRFVRDNAYAAKHTFNTVLNPALPESVRSESEGVSARGKLGFILGAGFGVIMAVTAIALRLIVEVISHFTNKLIAASSGVYLVGKGAVVKTAGAVADAAISLWRVGYEIVSHFGEKLVAASTGVLKVSAATIRINGRAFKTSFVSLANSALPEDYRFNVSPSESSRLARYSVGIIGAIIGSATGFAVAACAGMVRATIDLTSHLWIKSIAAAVGVVHVAKITANFIKDVIKNISFNNFATTRGVFVSMVNLVLPAGSRINERFALSQDQRGKAKIFGVGIAGVVLGGAFGVLSAAVIGMVRIGMEGATHLFEKGVAAAVGMFRVGKNFYHHNKKSAKYSYKSAANLTLPDDYQMVPEHADTRANYKKYGIGIIGAVVGSAVGSIQALLVGLCRVGFEGGTHFAEKSVASMVGIGSVLIEVCAQTANSMAYTFASIINHVLPSPLHMRESDQRPIHQKYGIGLIGILAGSALGMLAAGIIGTSRILIEASLHFGEKLVAAFTGIYRLTALTAGIVKTGFVHLGKATIEVVSHLSNKLVAAATGVYHVGRVVLSKAAHAVVRSGIILWRVGIDIVSHFLQKAIAAMRGIWWVGVKAVKLTGEFLNNTRLSFQALSGSLLNFAFYNDHFHGLAGDTRSAKQKAVGIIGYVLALPFAALSLKYPLTLVLSVAASPIVFAFKATYRALYYFIEGLKMCCACFRAPPPVNLVIENDAQVKQAFKNVISSLNSEGNFDPLADEFEPGKYIEPNGNGLENWRLFLRKCFSFNGKTLTEATADYLWDEYEKLAGQGEGQNGLAFFDENQPDSFDNTVAAIQKTETSGMLGFFATKSQKAETKAEIRAAAELIRSYVNEHKRDPERRYQVINPIVQEPSLTYRQAFFGRPPVPSAPPEDFPAPSAPLLDHPEPSAPPAWLVYGGSRG